MSDAAMPVQLPLGFIPGSRARFANYVPAGNEEVVAVLRELCVAGATSVYLQGLSGSGKSHLLQAACRQASEQGRPALYLPLKDVVARPETLLEGLDGLGLLALDDPEALRGQRRWQEVLVALLDQLRTRGAALLFASACSPDALALDVKDLGSRLAWAVRYRLQPMDDHGREALLVSRAAERGLELGSEVVGYLLRHSARDPAALLAALDALDHASLAKKRRLTIPLVREVLHLA